MLGATALFTVMSAIIKGVSPEIHFIETMFFRSAFALPVMVVIAARGRDWGLLRTKRFPQHVVRAFTGTMAQGCSFYARCPYPKLKPAAGPQPPLADLGAGHCAAACGLCDSSLPIEDVLAKAQTA